MTNEQTKNILPPIKTERVVGEGISRSADGSPGSDLAFHEKGWDTDAAGAEEDLVAITMTHISHAAERRMLQWAQKQPERLRRGYQQLLLLHPNSASRERWEKQVNEK